MIILGVAVLLWGPGISKDQQMLISDTRQSVAYLKTQIEHQTADSAPVTEPKQIIDDKVLSRHNITLSDYDNQIPQVQEWLLNPYSGYPALVRAIRRVLGNNKLVGNAVPLTVINTKNLGMHDRGTDNPIISAEAIDSTRLKNAIYASWAEKNSGSLSNHKSFDDIVVPIP